jgi:signal transduction histidine kinase
MAQPSRTGGKTSGAKARNTSPAKSRKTTKTKRRIAPAATRAKRRSVSGPSKDLKEAREQQAATAEILKVIASSPGDVQPVLQALAISALRLCEALSATVLLRDGEVLIPRAHVGPLLAPLGERQSLHRGWVTGRAVLDRVTIHVPDLLETSESEYPFGKTMALKYGHRATLAVPLIRDGWAIGAILVRRRDPRPFSGRQIALLETFADQAVIALGNVRLFEEVQARTRDLQESLQQQTATADVLKVISRSAFDLQTVLDTLTESAAQLCEAESAHIFRCYGTTYRLAACRGYSREYEEHMRQRLFEPGRDSIVGRIALDHHMVHIPDVLTDPEYSQPESQKLGRWRTMLGVPLVREGVPIGALTLTRSVVKPFTDKQIELVTTFADQAVIAIENVRLFNETQEALERQTATADILKVIASSPDDVQPVFEAIAERSNRLVNGLSTAVYSLVGDTVHLMAFTPVNPAADAVLQASFPTPLSQFSLAAVGKGETYTVVDAEVDFVTRPSTRELARLRGWRSLLGVPLLRENKSIGLITVTRAEPGRFADHHVQLLQTFADQAVIAISNVGLFNDVQERTTQLSQSLDDLRAAQDRLVQTEKLASLGQLTAGIAHEIKNPLNFVNNFSALSAELTDELNDTLKPVAMNGNVRKEVDELTGMLRSNLEKVVQHGKRADSIVKNMLLHSREGSREHRPADINSLVDESLNLAYHGARAEKGGFNVTLQRDFDADAGTVELFPQDITRAFLNLIANGVYAATKRKTQEKEPDFEPTLRAATKNLGTTVEIRIRDNGTGIPAEVQQKMFNPFFTTKPAGEGTGLGLSMTHDIIVKQHGGRIDVATEPGQFTEFTIVLPRNLSGRDRGET